VPIYVGRQVDANAGVLPHASALLVESGSTTQRAMALAARAVRSDARWTAYHAWRTGVHEVRV
jgi:hypothetical protein